MVCEVKKNNALTKELHQGNIFLTKTEVYMLTNSTLKINPQEENKANMFVFGKFGEKNALRNKKNALKGNIPSRHHLNCKAAINQGGHGIKQFLNNQHLNTIKKEIVMEIINRKCIFTTNNQNVFYD